MSVTIFDRDRRAEAAEAGRPVLRMAAPALDPVLAQSDVVLIWLDDANKLVVGTPAEVVTGLGMASLAALVENKRIVCADDATLKALTRVIERDPTRNRKAIAVLRYSQSLASSVYLVDLTAGLRRKFWLPTGEAGTDIMVWAELIEGVTPSQDRTGRSFYSMLQSLLDACVDGETGEKGALSGAYTSVRSHEQAGRSAVRNSYSLNAASDAFVAAEKVAEATDTIGRLDLLYRHRCVAEGTVVRATPLYRDPSNSTVVFRVTQPCRLRKGEVLILNADESGGRNSAVLVEVGFDAQEEALTVSLRRPDPKGKVAAERTRRSPLDMALLNQESLFLTAKPFTTVKPPTSVGTRKWGVDLPDSAPTHVEDRDVPLDVILAGGVEAE